MKKVYILLLVTIAFVSKENLLAQTTWTGPTITFTKGANADWTLEENQDRITNNVWITRSQPGGGIFNIVSETNYDDFSSPADTEWAFGTVADIGSLNFDTWEDTHMSNATNLAGLDMVLHLITDDIYIDLKFISWASGGGGTGSNGAFSYERSSDQTVGLNDIDINNKLNIFPNPSTDLITISGLFEVENYTIYNILGTQISNGSLVGNQVIDIQNLTSGLYFLKFDMENTLKFVKK